MSSQFRSERIRKIRSDIDKYDMSVTVVAPGPLPRLAYTIGLRDVVGFELAMPGACYFTSREVHEILNNFGTALRADNLVRTVEVSTLGSFTLRVAHQSWARSLALGAFDYYSDDTICVMQVVPDTDHLTVDVPDVERIRRPDFERAWRWLSDPWDLPIPKSSLVTTNLMAVRGGEITELTRWAENEWEMFAGPGPDVSIDDVRVVPIGVLLGTDPSINVAFDTNIGEGYWRNSAASAWHEWKPRSS